MEVLRRLPPPLAEPGSVYRHFDAGGRLLYVGSTATHKIRDRHIIHSREARWWRFIARVEHIDCSTRREAYSLETATIRSDRPIFNRTSGDAAQSTREQQYLDSFGDQLAPWAARELPARSRSERTAQIDLMLRSIGVPLPAARRKSHSTARRHPVMDLGEFMAQPYLREGE